MAEETREKTNFIWEAIKADIAEGKNGGRVQTRFPDDFKNRGGKTGELLPSASLTPPSKREVCFARKQTHTE